jgi:hypothetical protein
MSGRSSGRYGDVWVEAGDGSMKPMFRFKGSLKKYVHIGRRFIPSGSVVKTRTTQMFLRFCALPDRRFNSQNYELIFSREP